MGVNEWRNKKQTKEKAKERNIATVLGDIYWTALGASTVLSAFTCFNY